LSRDKSLIYRETALFSGFASRQWFKNVLDVEVGEIMSVSLAGVGLLFQPNENKPWSNACVRTVTPNEVDENQDTCAVSSNY